MKKLLFITSFFLFTIQINAQDPDPDLFDQTWYLYDVYDSDFNTHFIVEGYQPYGGNPQIPQITPFVIIDESFNFNGLGICNTFNGTLEYSAADTAFRAVTSTQTTNPCGLFEDMDEPYLIGPFGYVDPDPTYFTIFGLTITNDSDGFQTLTYGTQPFIGYTYRNTPILANSDYKKNVVLLYPNPTKGLLNVSFENLIIESVMVYSVTGDMVLQPSFLSSSNLIDISSLTNGLYFIEIKSEEGIAIHKILKH